MGGSVVTYKYGMGRKAMERSMGFSDKIKGLLNLSDEDYYDEGVDEEFAPPAPSYKASKERASSRRERERETADNFASEKSFQRQSRANQDPNKVVNIHTTAQLQVVLVKPEKFEDASGIADNLNEKRTVVLNLESANRDVARRLVDFLSGVAYANNGQIQRVANSTYIITPYNVDLMGDLLDELENNGMFF